MFWFTLICTYTYKNNKNRGNSNNNSNNNKIIDLFLFYLSETWHGEFSWMPSVLGISRQSDSVVFCRFKPDWSCMIFFLHQLHVLFRVFLIAQSGSEPCKLLKSCRGRSFRRKKTQDILFRFFTDVFEINVARLSNPDAGNFHGHTVLICHNDWLPGAPVGIRHRYLRLGVHPHIFHLDIVHTDPELTFN